MMVASGSLMIGVDNMEPMSNIAWWLYELANREWIAQRDADRNSDACKAAHDLMVAAEVAYRMTLRLHHTKKRAGK